MVGQVDRPKQAHEPISLYPEETQCNVREAFLETVPCAPLTSGDSSRAVGDLVHVCLIEDTRSGWNRVLFSICLSAKGSAR